ncbi:HEAT repeat domain-containing protein [Paenibacillus sp. 19GGS1-52]|uniref:HEAT repeat domain-containing protein n=1 Tax=Paenibacillus sp. 19GGS1-52 TaxID=2758563 RepID=UPI001EFA2F70|nr:HEAT repeat domain-containing protein [Paenibacillus sp. 19GGS1-52]ULO08512.1 HEAT repeat domain-containing protein [Paenibacillus sp. 19GGS1-52]
MFIDLFSRLNIILPDALFEELESHYIKQKEQPFLLRLMESVEITETVQFMSNIEVYHGIIPLWTDNNSNYIGINIQGVCKYRISYLNHEETNLSPGFRSIKSFTTQIEQHPNFDWDELKKDYPTEIETNNNNIIEDLNCINELNNFIRANLLNTEIRCQFVFSIMALTPRTHLDTLVKY